MTAPSIDFSGVDIPPQIDPGEHRACVISAEQSTSKRGNPILVVEWEIREGTSDGGVVRQWLTQHYLTQFAEQMYGRGLTRGLDLMSAYPTVLPGAVALISVDTIEGWDRVTSVRPDPDPEYSAFTQFWMARTPEHREVPEAEYALDEQAIVMRTLAEVTAFYAAHGIV